MKGYARTEYFAIPEQESFCKKLMELEHSPNGLVLHIFHVGGAKATAQAGVPDCLFKSMKGGSQIQGRASLSKT